MNVFVSATYADGAPCVDDCTCRVTIYGPSDDELKTERGKHVNVAQHGKRRRNEFSKADVKRLV